MINSRISAAQPRTDAQAILAKLDATTRGANARMRKGRREVPPPLRPLGLGGGDGCQDPVVPVDERPIYRHIRETRGTGTKPVPLGTVRPAGATEAGSATHFGSRGEMGTGLATRPLVRSAGGGDGCQRHAPSRQGMGETMLQVQALPTGTATKRVP